MKKIGIITAVDSEMATYRENIQNLKTLTRGQFEILVGTYANYDIYLCRAGVGKVNSAIAATILAAQGVDLLINSGSAGAIGQGVKQGDIVLADKTTYHDVDVTYFGNQLGQMDGMPPYYTTDTMITQSIAQVLRSQNMNVHIGQILTGDSFVADKLQAQQYRSLFPQALCVEMEGAAMGQTAYRFGLPFVILRVMSDNADNSAGEAYEKVVKAVGATSAQAILTYLKQA